jgi:hypothetical protein
VPIIATSELSCNALAGREQLLELRRLRGDLKVTPERWTLALARYGVASARYLTTTQAQQLIDAMAVRLSRTQAHLAACGAVAARLRRTDSASGAAGGEADDACFAGEDGWAAPLRDLQQAFGMDAVREAGLRVLQYPTTWCTSAAEFAAVRRALSAGAEGGVPREPF